MPATIKIKNSSTASAVPTSSDLVQGELAVNVTDRRIFTENASGTVVELGTNPTILTMGAAGSASAPVITRTGDTNTGIFFPAADTIAFAEGGVEAMRLDSSGNLGLGVTPSAWGGSFKALQVGAVGSTYVSSAGDVIFGRNTYNNGTNSLYLTSNFASAYGMISGQHQWFTASSGTAGNAITFTQAMTLDASGRLGIGTTSPSTVLSLASSNQPNHLYTGATGAFSWGQFNSSGDASINNGANANLLFATNNTERARIDPSGNLLVGTASTLNNTAAHLQVLGISTDDSLAVFRNGSGRSAGNIIFQNASATQVGYIQATNSATLYATSSDYRLKNTIAPMTGALAKVAALKPVTYKWNSDNSDGEGFIAHELAEVCPQAVVGEKDAVDADGNPQYQGIDTSLLIATLTAALQEMKAIIETLTARIEALEA